MAQFIIMEVGNSTYTEFKMKNGEFEQTEDIIVVDEIEAKTALEAYNKMLKLEEHKDKKFHKITIREISLERHYF